MIPKLFGVTEHFEFLSKFLKPLSIFNKKKFLNIETLKLYTPLIFFANYFQTLACGFIENFLETNFGSAWARPLVFFFFEKLLALFSTQSIYLLILFQAKEKVFFFSNSTFAM